MWTIPQPITSLQEHISLERYLWQTLAFLDLSILFLTILMQIHTYIFGLLVTMEILSINGLKLK